MSIKKIKVIARNPDHYLRETKFDIHKIQRNFDPDLHPFEAAREYKLALNAAKLDRVFAKPFIASLQHSEAISCLSRHPQQLSCVFSGNVEGELRLWDLSKKQCKWNVQAHNGRVFAIEAAPDGASFLTVGNDKTIKRWSLENALKNTDLPKETWLSETMINGISHHRFKKEFITCGEKVYLWDASMKAPKFCYDWHKGNYASNPSVHCVKFNPVETELFASCDQDNSIILYDTRAKDVKKLRMTNRVNAIAWNPMEAFMLTAASDDYNCYTYDIRNMRSENCVAGIYFGHTEAVTDIYYSPTGKEFVTGSHDRSLRVFKIDQFNSRDIYHTKRMFKINCVLWTADNKYLLSGSNDHNMRLWKATANEKMGIMSYREQAAINYTEELKKKYKMFPQVRRILNHRHLPKKIYVQKKQHDLLRAKIDKKMHIRKTKPRGDKEPYRPFKLRPVVGLQDEDDEHDERNDYRNDNTLQDSSDSDDADDNHGGAEWNDSEQPGPSTSRQRRGRRY